MDSGYEINDDSGEEMTKQEEKTMSNEGKFCRFIKWDVGHLLVSGLPYSSVN